MQATFTLLVIIGYNAISALTLLPEEKQFGDEVVKQCITETSISKSILEMHEINDENRENAGSFALCISKKVGYQDDKGNLQTDDIRKVLTSIIGNNDKVTAIMKKCFVQKSTAEETALSSLICFSEEISAD
ncbi:B2 protein-like [Rhynchophorus ferrugineus]|uniref:B2 protein-like n=1 Tax=Rhynchophorus ferrugineus TaxID=354439 RepID=UPI003FCCC088